MSVKTRIPLLDFYGLLMSIAVLYSRSSLLGDPGVGWHLRTGEWISNAKRIPDLDPFLKDALYWINDQWLSDVILWRVYVLGGFPALHVLVVLVSVGTFLFVLAPLARRTEASPLAVFLLLFLVSLLASLQWFLRPVIFSFLLFAAAYRFSQNVLERGTITRRELLPIAVFFAVWANLHAGFWLGLYLLGVTTLELLLRRGVTFLRAAAAALAGLAATLINPWAGLLWANTLGLTFDPYFTRLNREWLSPELSEAAFLPVNVILSLLVLALVRGKNLSRFDWLLLVPLLALSLLHRRYLPFLGIALYLPLLRLYPGARLGRLPVSASGRPYLTTAFWAFLLFSAMFLKRVPVFDAHMSGFPPDLPRAEIAALAASPGPVFHSPDIGGFITWTAWPRVRPLLDDRNQLLGRGPYEDFFSVVRVQPGWDELLERDKIEWVLIGAEYPLRWVLDESAAWLPVSGSGGWRLYRRRN